MMSGRPPEATKACTHLTDSLECMAVPQARPAPSPRRGEGWGEGVTIERLVPPLPSRSRMFPTSTMSLSGRTRVNPSSAGERESRRAAFQRCAQQRTQRGTRQGQIFFASPSPGHRAIGPDVHIIVARRRVRRNIAGIEIALDQLQRTLVGRAIAAPATGLDADEVSRRQPEALLLLDRSHRAGFAVDEREAARLALLPALHTPGRKARAVEVGLQLARREYPVALAKAEPASEFAGAAGSLAQRELLDPHRQIALLQFKRNDAGVAMRHIAERTRAVMCRAGAPTAMPAVMGGKIAAIRSPAGKADAGMGGEMPARHPLWQRLLERLDHRIDHGREWGRIIAHRGGRVRAEELAGRQHELKRAERAFVRHLVSAHQIFERDARSGLAAAEPAGIDRTFHLLGDKIGRA